MKNIDVVQGQSSTPLNIIYDVDDQELSFPLIYYDTDR